MRNAYCSVVGIKLLGDNNGGKDMFYWKHKKITYIIKEMQSQCYIWLPRNRSPTDVMMWTVFIDLTNICDTMKSYREEGEERLVGCGGEVPGRQTPAPGRQA